MPFITFFAQTPREYRYCNPTCPEENDGGFTRPYNEQCGQVIEGRWRCTRLKSHAGPHVSGGPYIYARWIDEV